MRQFAVLAFVGLAMSLAACGGTETAGDPAETLPPHTFEELAGVFDPIVGPLGYEVTRGALIVRATYQVSPDGDHLALYLAPVDDISNDQFAADLAFLADALIPLVFDTWPELVSFDVCQEPFGATEQTPPSLTIIDLDRDAATQVTWDEIDLSTLIQAGYTVEGLSVWARSAVRDSATWTDAADG